VSDKLPICNVVVSNKHATHVISVAIKIKRQASHITQGNSKDKTIKKSDGTEGQVERVRTNRGVTRGQRRASDLVRPPGNRMRLAAKKERERTDKKRPPMPAESRQNFQHC
jgi:hypothetical protein